MILCLVNEINLFQAELNKCKEELKLKNDEITVINGTQKETVAGFEKSIETLEVIYPVQFILNMPFFNILPKTRLTLNWYAPCNFALENS